MLRKFALPPSQHEMSSSFLWQQAVDMTRRDVAALRAQGLT
jgi:hypothetical protein